VETLARVLDPAIPSACFQVGPTEHGPDAASPSARDLFAYGEPSPPAVSALRSRRASRLDPRGRLARPVL